MIKETITIATYNENVLEKDREFLGKSVVVTGTGAGMGKSITEELLQQLRNSLMIMDIIIQVSLLTKQTGRHILSRQVLKSLRIQMVTWIMQ